MKLSRAKLQIAVDTLNISLERPFSPYNYQKDKLFISNVGHLCLNYYPGDGYRLSEILSIDGRESDWSDKMKLKEMDAYLQGMIRGIGLHGNYIGRLMIKNQLIQAGKTPTDSLYDEANVTAANALRNAIVKLD